MRKLNLAFGSFALSMLLALSVSAQAPSLKDTMKEIGSIYKPIVKSAMDASMNARNAEAAGKLIELFKTAQTLLPDLIKHMPADKQSAAIAEFQAILQKEIEGATALQAAFAANDNAGAVKIISEMNSSKKNGHDKFDPEG